MTELGVDYQSLVKHYESCFQRYGDSHKVVDWPNLKDAQTRYKVMLGLLDGHVDENEMVRLADIGCGSGHLLEYIAEHGITNVEYLGHDLSTIFVKYCRDKYPDTLFFDGDLLSTDFPLPEFDFAVMNGVFTEKRKLSFEDMNIFFQKMLNCIFQKTKRGMAFNVMSKNVDWERDDLFHLSLDSLTEYLTRQLSKNYIIRNDYGLYEYTVYVYK